MSLAVCDGKCVWGANLHFCKLLQKRGIPLDNKWPPLVLALRASPYNPLYNDMQKTALQNVLLRIMEEGDCTDTSYYERQKEVLAILVEPVEKKIQDISDEVEAISLEVNQLLRSHSNDVSQIADDVDSNMASGRAPEKILSDLRASLRQVVESFEADKAKFESLSFVDSQTKLANRRKFDVTIKDAVRDWQESRIPVSLILFDIDFFKKFNDTYGHLVGDDILSSIAKIVKHTLGSLDWKDYLAARYGGDEFAIILFGPVVSKTKIISEALRTAVAKATMRIKSIDDPNVEFAIKATISVGASTLLKRGRDDAVQSLIDSADRALYHAKEVGRNCAVFYTPGAKGKFTRLPEGKGAETDASMNEHGV